MNRSHQLSEALLSWYAQNHRDLPWRNTSDPYAIWISEIMLQQTQVDTVLDYYQRFLTYFPDVFRLGNAEEEEVLSLWKGLGYYTRARNIHRAAHVILEQYHGIFPNTYPDIRALPGIGDYTAGAITSIAYNQSYPAVDGNVLRVISRLEGIAEDISLQKTKSRITGIVTAMIPAGKAGDFNQAMMDLGAAICVPKDPQCAVCPWQQECMAYKSGKEAILPLKKKAKAPIKLAYWAAVIVHNGAVLMTHRNHTALLGNMWGVPMVLKKTGVSPEILFLDEWELDLTEAVYLGQAKHVFSHQVWHMDIICFTLGEDVMIANAEGRKITNKPPLAWISHERFNTLPIPKAFQKVLALAADKIAL